MRPTLFATPLMAMALLASGAAFAQLSQVSPPAGAPPASLVREGVTEKLTEHVWAIPDGSASLVPNVGIIVGSKAVLVVDTGLGARNGQTVLREVAKIAGGTKPIYIVATHAHPEHDLGAGAFPKDSKLIRSNDQAADSASSGMNLANMFAERSPLNKGLVAGSSPRQADITFDKDYTLDLGGMSAKIFAMGTNHTKGDTVVLVEGVLFSGDVAMRPQPSFAAGAASSIRHWLESLDRLDAMKPVHVVPSHGARGDAAIIAGYRTYLTRIRDRAIALRRERKSEAEAVQIITDEMAGQYPDRGRLGGAIRAAYAEALQ